MEFEHTLTCPAPRAVAWQFWSNVNNWAVVDPAVEWVKLEGDFVAGTVGRTKPVGLEPNEWRLAEVQDGTSAIIEVQAPGAVLRFLWTFSEIGAEETSIEQRVTLQGEQAADYEEALQGLAQGIPAGMEKLKAGIIQAAQHGH